MRSISIVEYKVKQTDFFLTNINEMGHNFFGAQCFTDAFVSAARSVTFAMQAVNNDIKGFAEWYKLRQEQLRADSLIKFFNEYRVISTHIGDTVVRGGFFKKELNGEQVIKYYFKPIAGIKSVPNEDVFTACCCYFKTLLAVVFEAFVKFKYQLDDRWYFTAENFYQTGKTIEDAEEELGLPRGWTQITTSSDESNRWRMIRMTQAVGCQINDQFVAYLGKSIEGPDRDM